MGWRVQNNPRKSGIARNAVRPKAVKDERTAEERLADLDFSIARMREALASGSRAYVPAILERNIAVAERQKEILSARL